MVKNCIDIRTSFTGTCLLLVFATLLLMEGCAFPHRHQNTSSTSSKDSAHFVEARHGVVVSVSGPASEVGLAILKQGGNAVDATVGVAFALAVAYPPAGNIAGGGFMLVHPGLGKADPIVFDYRECAPEKAFSGMFTKEESQFTHKSVAVPGTVRGLELAHQRFGTLPWRELIKPAIELAHHGFILDTNLAESMNATLALAAEQLEFQRVFGKPGGGRWQGGDRLVQPELARTLQLLADEGPDAFYTGPIAKEFVAEMSREGGLITADDLANYHPLERKPLSTRYRNKFDVYVPPPPSAGGTVLLEELNILEGFRFKTWGRSSARTLHVMAEAMRRANRDRARYLGDPSFTKIPQKLITKHHGKQLAATIELKKATPSETLPTVGPAAIEGESTTQFSIIDRDGMAVANTYTLERRWGSRIVAKNMGFLLNNDMRAFNLFPNDPTASETNATSPRTVANLVAPGKRPLSSMTPTIIAENGHVKMITGSPGSQAIPHTVLEIIMNVFEFGMPLDEAVAAPRFSHQWFPDQITFEAPEQYPETMNALKAMGHTVIKTGPLPQGDAHTILVVNPHKYIGVADRRINGCAAGY